MHGIHLADLVRSLNEPSSRRGIVGGALGGLLGAHGLAEADAGKRRKKRRRRKRRKQRKQERRKEQQEAPQPPPHICQGRNVCVGNIQEARCSSDPNCFCFVTAEGEPYCGKGNSVASCQQCEQLFPGRDCFPGGGSNCAAFDCLEPCPV